MLPPDLIARLRAVADLPRVVLATDFDGTLAPFVEDPMAAAPIEGALDLLRAAARFEGVTVALVSGRDVDTLRRLSTVTAECGIDLIGSHGAQSSRDDLAAGDLLDDAARTRLADLDAALVAVQGRHPQARIERKPAAVALHTRGLSPDVATAALADASALGERDGVHALAGKSVVELGVVQANKGLALQALKAAVGADAVIYLGDDVTDEHAFTRLSAAQNDVTIKVGEGETAAAHRVPAIEDVVAVLALFVDERGRR